MMIQDGKWLLLYGMCIFVVCAQTPKYSVKSQPAPDPVVIHERIGKFIEPEEREYYNLFHGIEGFEEAVFFNRWDGGFDILIMSERHTYYAIYDVFQAGEIVHDYIEHYDAISIAQDNFVKKWNIVGYDTLGLPFTKNDVDRILVKHGISARAVGFGCLGGCLGACYGCRDLDPESNDSFSSTHIPSCSFTGGEDAPYWCLGGFFAGLFITHNLEKYFTRRNPIPHINKRRGPWVIE